MQNTLFLDDELLFRRPSHREPLGPLAEVGLAEVEFADMEPVDASDLVGVPPYEVMSSIPFPDLDLVGVPGSVAVAVAHREPLALRGRIPVRTAFEELPTEEFQEGSFA